MSLPGMPAGLPLRLHQFLADLLNIVVSGNSNRPVFMPHPGSSCAAIRLAARDIPRSLRFLM